MNKNQEMFKNFILTHVKVEKVEEINEILKESFKKQDEGTFNLEYLEDVMKRILDCIKDDSKDIVLNAMNHFKKDIK